MQLRVQCLACCASCTERTPHSYHTLIQRVFRRMSSKALMQRRRAQMVVAAGSAASSDRLAMLSHASRAKTFCNCAAEMLPISDIPSLHTLPESIPLPLKKQKAQGKVCYKYEDQRNHNGRRSRLANAFGATRGGKAPRTAHLHSTCTVGMSFPASPPCNGSKRRSSSTGHSHLPTAE